MDFTNVYKVVIMENCKTSSLVWVQFIKAKNNVEIEDWIKHSDCKLLYVARLEKGDIDYTDKPIDEIKNGEMIYHK